MLICVKDLLGALDIGEWAFFGRLFAAQVSGLKFGEHVSQVMWPVLAERVAAKAAGKKIRLSTGEPDEPQALETPAGAARCMTCRKSGHDATSCANMELEAAKIIAAAATDIARDVSICVVQKVDKKFADMTAQIDARLTEGESQLLVEWDPRARVRTKAFEYSRGKLPARKTQFSAGYDVTPLDDHVVAPHCGATIPTGLKLKLSSDHMALFLPKTGRFSKGLLVCGVGDADYEGHYSVAVWNLSSEPLAISKNESFCQFVLVEYANPVAEVVSSIGRSDMMRSGVRGARGLGSKVEGVELPKKDQLIWRVISQEGGVCGAYQDFAKHYATMKQTFDWVRARLL